MTEPLKETDFKSKEDYDEYMEVYKVVPEEKGLSCPLSNIELSGACMYDEEDKLTPEIRMRRCELCLRGQDIQIQRAQFKISIKQHEELMNRLAAIALATDPNIFD